MHPHKVGRDRLRRFTDLPNIGPAMARDFASLGYDRPQQLAGADPLKLYASLCASSGRFQDPCVLDTLMSVTHFLAGGKAQPWWHYTAARKQRYAAALTQLREGTFDQSVIPAKAGIHGLDPPGFPPARERRKSHCLGASKTLE